MRYNRKCLLNNRMVENARKNDTGYQALLIDLALTGEVSIAVAESLLGYEIPDHITLPAHFETELAKRLEETDDKDDTAEDSEETGTDSTEELPEEAADKEKTESTEGAGTEAGAAEGTGGAESVSDTGAVDGAVPDSAETGTGAEPVSDGSVAGE